MDMKKTMIILVLGALVACLVPVTVQAQDWQTNTMQGSGSSYSSPITPVGATNVNDQATTTYSSPNRITGRRNFDTYDDPNASDQSPIGSEGAFLLFVAAAAGILYLRKRRAVV